VRLDDDIVPWLLGAARGQLPDGTLRWRDGAAVCVVLAAAGYPGTPAAGDPIDGLAGDGDDAGDGDVLVFHAGTRRAPDGRIVTAGGRVLGVTARGRDLSAARAVAYGAIERIHFTGMHFRKDIGARGAT
jgi:phosphoribosylamine--glycine ligase